MGIINKILSRFNINLNWNYPRPSISYIKNINNEKELMGVEIGTFKGENAKSILETLNIRKLYLIDPYNSKKYIRYNSICEKGAKRKLRYHKNKIVWIKKMSDEAVDYIPNNLDFVYIDGNHEYEYVKKDLESYYDKLKEGGF